MAAVNEKQEIRSQRPFAKWELSCGGTRSLTFEELAALQGIGPVGDPNELAGGWPGEVDDGFEEAVLAWRRQGLSAQE